MSSSKDKKEPVKKLKSEKQQISTQLDKFYDFISNSDEFTNKISANERYSKCEQLWDKFNVVQVELEFLDDSQRADRIQFEENNL